MNKLFLMINLFEFPVPLITRCGTVRVKVEKKKVSLMLFAFLYKFPCAYSLPFSAVRWTYGRVTTKRK